MNEDQLEPFAKSTFEVLFGMTEADQAQLINYIIKKSKVDTNLISDGYHTFAELYEHRIVNFIVVCRQIDSYNKGILNIDNPVWRSKAHSDGSIWDGWFILGINIDKGEQITYHIPMDKWDDCNFTVFTQAPEWDGHTSADVLERLKKL